MKRTAIWLAPLTVALAAGMAGAQLAKRQPDKLAYASSGNGSYVHE